MKVNTEPPFTKRENEILSRVAAADRGFALSWRDIFLKYCCSRKKKVEINEYRRAVRDLLESTVAAVG